MIDDLTLRKVLKLKIKLIKEYPRSLQKKVEFEMANRYNVKFGDTVDIFNNITPNTVDELSYNMLFKLMSCIREIALNSEQKIDASDLFANTYFTEQEIIEFNIPYAEEEKDFDLVITDWKQKSPTLYKIYTNIDEVIQWRNFNKLRFNPETQRDLIPAIVNGKKVSRLDMNRASINEMKSLMKKNMYYNVVGTININPDISSDVLPYKDGRNLVIPKEAHMDLIEGFHNYIAETEVKDENLDWKFDIEFDLRIMNVEECSRFIVQMNKKNPFKPSQVTRIDKLSEINYVIDSLNSRSTFHLYSTIDNNMKTYLNKLLTNIFGSIQEREKSIELLIELEKCLNYVTEKYKHFNKPFTKKEFLLYICLIKYSKENNIEFTKLLDNLNNDEMLLEFKQLNDPSPKNLKRINKYITEVMKNVQ